MWNVTLKNLIYYDKTLSLTKEHPQGRFFLPQLQVGKLGDDASITGTAYINASVNATGGSLPSGSVLLNNQSSVNFYSDYSKVSNIQEALRPITITTAVVSVVCTKIGVCEVTNIYVWMRPKPGNLNIISFSQADHMGLDVGWCPAQR